MSLPYPFTILSRRQTKRQQGREVTVSLAILNRAELNLHPRPCSRYSLFLCWKGTLIFQLTNHMCLVFSWCSSVFWEKILLTVVRRRPSTIGRLAAAAMGSLSKVRWKPTRLQGAWTGALKPSDTSAVLRVWCTTCPT